jgi:hypothetical protein
MKINNGIFKSFDKVDGAVNRGYALGKMALGCVVIAGGDLPWLGGVGCYLGAAVRASDADYSQRTRQAHFRV